jgi:transcriptional regulator with XRE-family HTH domain
MHGIRVAIACVIIPHKENRMRRKTDPSRLIDMHVGRQLRVMRAARGMTQEMLADKLQISYQQLHKYETGANSISASRLYDTSKLLGVSPDMFFEGLQNILPDASMVRSYGDDSLLSRNQMLLLKSLSMVPEGKRGALLGLIRAIGEDA